MVTFYSKIAKKLFRNSIRTKVITVILLFILPLVLLLIIYNFYSFSLLREETAKSNKNTLRVYSETLDGKLDDVDSLLLNIIINNPNYNILRSERTELEVQLSVFELIKIYEQGLSTNKDIDMFFIYNEVNNIQREVYRIRIGNNYSGEMKSSIRDKLLEIIIDKDNTQSKKWFPIYINDRYFLLRILGSKGNYVGAIIDFSNIPIYLSDLAITNEYTILYNTDSGKPLLNASIVEDNDVDLSLEDGVYQLSGHPKRYMVISEKLHSGELYMTVLIPDSSILKGLNMVQIILFIISLLTVLVIPLSITVLRRTVTTPLSRLVNTINAIKDGHLESKMATFTSEEFVLVSETFNDMIDEIKALKILTYEENLARQKAQLQYLMFQIKPHFYLNSLKNLYGMAEGKQFRAIQDMVLGLSTHFRYIFNDNAQLVSVKEELNYVQNFLNIHNLSVESPIECIIDADEMLMSAKIPPISIQTFIENSLKYGMRPNQPLRIIIKISELKTEEGDYLDLSVSDNGFGFSEEIINKINFSTEFMRQDGHIGLKNVIQRLKLIYGEKAQVVVSNSIYGGANTEMIIPIEKREGAE